MNFLKQLIFESDLTLLLTVQIFFSLVLLVDFSSFMGNIYVLTCLPHFYMQSFQFQSQ